MDKDELNRIFKDIPIREYNNTVLDYYRDEFIKMEKARGFLDARHIGNKDKNDPDIRDIVYGWVKPEDYTTTERNIYGEDARKVPKYRTDTRLCHIVEKSVINNLGILDKVYYYICYRSTNYQWNKSWWRHVNIAKYENTLGLLINFPIARRMYEKKGENALQMTSLVICLDDKDHKNHTFWYAHAPEVVDFINKYQLGFPIMTPWGSEVFGVSKEELFTENDMFPYRPPEILA